MSLRPQTRRFPKERFSYQPCDFDFENSDFSPWPSEILMHYYNKKHPACHYPQILKRIPRKLDGKLWVDDSKCEDPKAGWGMHLVHGIDKVRVSINVLILLVLCSLIGFAWYKCHSDDVQGATGIAQCLMYFVTVLITSMVSQALGE